MKVPSIRTKSVSTSIHPAGKIFQNLAAIWVGSPENRVYGNSVVLNHFAGLNKRKIHGRLQHGWPAHSLNGLYYKNDHLTTFVWRHATERAAKRMGWKSFHSIGAPWLYLLKILEADGWDVSGLRNVGAREKVLWVYGRHSLEISNSEDCRLLEFLGEANAQSVEGDMCLLYFEDFDSLPSHVFSLFPNLEIVTLGQRSSSFLSDSHLVRLFHILQTTKEMKIDHPSSLVLYALTLNVKIGWIQNSAWDEALSLAKNLGMSDLVDLMCAAPDSSHHFRSFAYEHLGIESVKSREELKRTLGWGGGFKNFFRFLLLPIRTLINVVSRLAR